jgi:chemotaxis protein MotA
MNLLGIFWAVGCVIAAMIWEGGHPSALINGPAFLIVIAGTCGCVMVQYPIKVFIGALKRFGWLVKPPMYDLWPTANRVLHPTLIPAQRKHLAAEKLRSTWQNLGF